ncbi:Uncharacterised protein (plasmid) [Legionella adelaidensis]|uniref:Uncharacterized protein n=1 Tax=Legionella adelaidensis TaxID=45056 RepID=A0A0W0R6D7_9GAMM|nr:hypothetical protein [Legionella adelaidensis]KTC66586.1 hypothetical protein Lade_1244 [Legionella adelaidensis]VEH85493.1 Uncharacterised protein [Legionella adelaidensis]
MKKPTSLDETNCNFFEQSKSLTAYVSGSFLLTAGLSAMSVGAVAVAGALPASLTLGIFLLLIGALSMGSGVAILHKMEEAFSPFA